MARNKKKSSHTQIVLIHPSSLFMGGLKSLLQDTAYKLTSYATSFALLQGVAVADGNRLVFIVGGRSIAQTVSTVRNVRAQIPSAYIIVIGDTAEPDEVMSAIEAGACGYWRDTKHPHALISAIELVLQDETVLPSEFVRSLPTLTDELAKGSKTPAMNSHSPYQGALNGPNASHLPISKVPLSSREELILQGLIEGAANKLIAQRLQIAEATVKVHVKAILRKIRVKNRTQAAIWAIRYLAEPDQRGSANHSINGRSESL
jgi:two-component system nitrate/nitrite response regulator NarL